MAFFNLNINGKEHQVDVDPNTALLWVLRDHLKLTGTKYGCGQAQCGSCTVLVDGEIINSCTTTVDVLEGQKITTIEGLSENGDHPVQKAWLEHNVAQCGYCQPGQIMAAVGLLNRNPNPNDKEIEEAMSGNICRCGTYTRIKEAIKTAASRQ